MLLHIIYIEEAKEIQYSIEDSRSNIIISKEQAQEYIKNGIDIHLGASVV